MAAFLFLKANPNHDRLGRFAGGAGGGPPLLPPSSGIGTAAQAESYWRTHFAGKTLKLQVKTKANTYSLSVRFDDANTHMWTRAAEPGDAVAAYDRPNVKAGPRAFDPARAQMMDRLFSTIAAPWRIVPSEDRRHVYIASPPLPDGGSYVVVLNPRDKGTNEFVSAHPRTREWVLRQHGRVPPEGKPLQKSEAPPFGGAFSVSTRFAGPAPGPGQGFQDLAPAAVAADEADRPAEAGQYLATFLDLFKALAPGERWITVRPHGPGTEGQPVLVKPTDDGAFKVIGGAGGSLNHLKLTGVKSEADYKAEARGKDQDRREAKKRQRERDREAGLTGNKKAAREAIRGDLATHEAAFVKEVGEALGWKPEETRFPEEKWQNASPAALNAAARKHARALLQRAKAAVAQQRQRLLADADARTAAGLGEVKLNAPAEELSVQDLDPITPATKGFGYTTNYTRRAAEAGLTPEELAAEAEAAKPPPEDGKPRTAPKGPKIAAALNTVRDPAPAVPPAEIVDVKRAVELLKAEKALKAVAKDARAKVRAVDAAKAPIEPKAFVLEEVGKPVDTDVVKDLEQDLRTLNTRAFLDGVGKLAGKTESLGRYIGVGAYNSINAVALAAGGAALLDRSVVDVLGIAGSAQVLARRLAKDLTPAELEETRAAMETFHTDHYMRASDKALREAREWHEAAASIELPDGSTGADLAVAQELNAKRRDLVQKAQDVLGTALGEMEANAALVVALKQPAKDEVQVSLGATSIEDAIRQARAIGLERGDYAVEKAGASTMLTVKGSGMDKLAQPVSREDLEHTRGALDIIEGRADEDGWLPAGVARRPDLAMNVPPGVAPRLANPFPNRPEDMEAAVRDYIGGRAADGDAPADIMADLLSEDTMRAAGDRQAFMRAVESVAPLYDADGKMVRAEAYAPEFEKMADAFVARRGGKLAPIHRQNFTVDQVSIDALHRALAERPEGVAAFKPLADLTPQDQAALRDVFAKEYGKGDPDADKMRAELERLGANEPEREVDDMFGRGPNPAWADWKAKRDGLAEKLNASMMTWGKYLDVMGSPQAAYAAMQDVVRGEVLKRFADHHNKLRPRQPLKIGRTVIRNDLNHLDALDPEARERRLAEHRGMVDRLRNRVAGKYAAGAVADKIDAARAAEEAAQQAQLGMFSMDDAAGKAERPLELGERVTIGHAAERTVAGMMPHVGANFRPGEPVKLWKPDMSGKYVGRQRAVKLIEHDKHAVLGMGVGSGKTAIALSAFTDLHAQGKATRGIFAVPSIVQGQFHGEALTMLEPGKYKWHCQPGASREERLAAYRDPATHFCVVTHQAFRDDMLHLAAKHEGSTPDAIADKLEGMSPKARQTFMRDVMDGAGIHANYLAVDEGHNLLNRAGKENSHMANVIDAVAHGMDYHVSMSADPVKNDASEAFDVLHKMDPVRYSDRAAFMRKYGVNTAASREGLRREMARHFYTGKVDPGVKAHVKEIRVEPSEDQLDRIKALDKAAARARMARIRGAVNVDAMRTLSPGSFEGVDPAQHEAVAAKLQRSVGIAHHAAVLHTLNGGAKIDAVARAAKERKGKPGVVFCRSLAHVQSIEARLKAEGHRVVVLTGRNSSKEKDRIKRQFQGGAADVIVCSDAGAVGANLQRGKWLVQVDTPSTAMTHAQRRGRIHRIGQTEDVEVLDLVANHAAERRERKRLAEKYDLRDVATSPLEGLDDTGFAGFLKRLRSGQAEAGRPMYQPTETSAAQPDPQGAMF